LIVSGLGMILGRVRNVVGLALRSADGTTGEGAGHLVEPPGNEPQVKPLQGSGCLFHAGQGAVIAPILPEVNGGVHTWREGFLWNATHYRPALEAEEVVRTVASVTRLHQQRDDSVT
jgi:hypothetical protein